MRKMRKSLSRAFLINFIVCGLAISSIIQFGVVQVSTQVSGILNSDTTWTLENSPYIVTGDIFIDENVTFTVDHGVEVKVAGYYGILLGSGAILQARGTEANPIVFTTNGTNYQGAWKGILIHAGTENSRIYLNHTIIKFAEKAVGFTDSDGERNSLEVVIENSKLLNNTEGVGFQTPYKVDKAKLYVNNSVIEGNTVGINLYSPFFGSTIVLFNNIVPNNVVGIRLSDGVHESTIVTLQKNIIIWNDIGIQIGVGVSSGLGLGSPVYVLQNNIAKNRIGIVTNIYHHYLNGSLLINNNNIYSNIEYNFEVATDYGVYMEYNTTYNWWGTTDVSAINPTIYDFNDDFNLGTVTFVPFLTERNPEAPSLLLLVDFTSSPATLYAHGMITFDASASSSEYSNITSYTWDFGDGNVTTQSTPIATHIYTVPANYKVTLTITDEFVFQNSTIRSFTVLQDNVPPVTDNNHGDSWHTSDFAINLTAVDHESGVAETYYRINDGATKTVSADGQPIVNTEGANNTLEYWSIDNAGNEETPKLVTGIKLDKVAPSGSVVINENAAYTTSTSVTLTVSADDAISGVAQMSFSNDGTEWSIWENYSTSKTWTLSAVDGTKTVYVQFKDNADLVSESIQDSIILDTIKPKAYAGQDQTVNVNTTLTFDASASSDNLGIVSYEWDFGDGVTGTGKTATHTYTNTGTYTVTLTVKDAAGNIGTHQITVTVLLPEEFPLWIIGVAAAVALTVAAMILFLWKRRKQHSQKD